jgi:TM2 domain-containing membrane protein YozV
MSANTIPASPKSRTMALLLAVFLGCFGAHRFYAGKDGTGVLMVLTLGGLGLWWIIDIIMVAVGRFADKTGLPIGQW